MMLMGMNMESGLMMVFHSVVIGVVAYLIMKFALKQSNEISTDRSILLSTIVLAYMILFGHNLPISINSNISSIFNMS
jgi:hypothetical protein